MMSMDIEDLLNEIEASLEVLELLLIQSLIMLDFEWYIREKEEFIESVLNGIGALLEVLELLLIQSLIMGDLEWDIGEREEFIREMFSLSPYKRRAILMRMVEKSDI